MESTNEKLTEQLNKLVEINNDRIEGYSRAEKETDDGDLKSLFNEMASHSQDFKSELSEQIRRIGGEPTESTTTSGKAYRAWMDVKAAVTGKDRKAIINSCEFGEDVALETYEEVLKSDELTGEARELVAHEKETLQQDHDRIRTLRDTTRRS